MESFYVVVASNSRVPGNTTSKFTNKLIDAIDLDSNWTVALSSIVYPLSITNIGGEETAWVRINWAGVGWVSTDDVYLPSTSFTDVLDLERGLNDYFNLIINKDPRELPAVLKSGNVRITNPTNQVIVPHGVLHGTDKVKRSASTSGPISEDPFKFKTAEIYETADDRARASGAYVNRFSERILNNIEYLGHLENRPPITQ